MTYQEPAPRWVVSAALDCLDTLDSLCTATVLLLAAKAEIERLTEIDSPDPRTVCDRACYLLDLFYEQELIPAMNTVSEKVKAMVPQRE